MHNHSGVYRAVVVTSDSNTGAITVAIPALGGSSSTFPITFIGRAAVDGVWQVPAANEVVLVAVDDASASTVFLIAPYTNYPKDAWALPLGGVANDLLVKNSSTNYDAAWSDAITVDSLTYDTVANESLTTVGQTVWDDTYGSPKTLLKGGNVYVANGQALYQRVTNTTGGTLTKGQAVYLAGSSGQKVTVALAQATTDSTSSKTMGVVAETIDHNQQGYVITEGLLQGFTTNYLSEGALIWLSPTTPGGLTTTKPSAPNHTVMIGMCVKSGGGSSGSIFVKIQNGYELEELHNISINAGTLAAGNVIVYDSATQLWKNVALSGDATVNSTGVVAIGSGVIVVADLSTATGEMAGVWNSDSTTTGFANVTINSGAWNRRWRKVGKTLYFQGYFTGDAVATALGTITVPLPAGTVSISQRRQLMLGANAGVQIQTSLPASAGNVTITANTSGGNFAAGASLGFISINGVVETQ